MTIGKKVYSIGVFVQIKSSNHQGVDDATNDDNVVVTIHLATMNKLQLFDRDSNQTMEMFISLCSIICWA